MNCNECQNLLVEHAIDLLEPDAQQQVAAHLSNGCGLCAQRLKEINNTWAVIPNALPAAIPPDAIKQDLLSRVRGQATSVLSPETESVHVTPQCSKLKVTKPWLALMPFIAASLVGLLTGYWFTSGKAPSTDSMSQYQSQLSETLRLFDKEQVYLSTLQISNQQPEKYGHLVWDSAAAQLHCYAFDLGELAEDSVFRLWFVTTQDEWHPVGDLEVQSDGVWTAVVPRPKLAKKWSRAVVTMEPAGSVITPQKPQGPIRLRGNFR